MTTITKERLLTIQQWRETYGLGSNVVLPAEEAEELARIALASLEAEPVAWKVTFTKIDREYNTFTGMYSDKAEVERWVRLHKACNFRADITPLYTAQPVPVTPDGWISCSERMPDDGQHVIILCDGAFVLYAQYRDGEFFDIVRNGDEFFETQSRNVTDWMPLPEPPQEVNRG
ncbi:TPA: DUF551 domain-containing protein [Escherichia coli]|uniref:DUF551 domain-containing protein n=1 Tax=Escherichia coli TaxID=562 RepID=UPI0018452238|nr:DUF551 domain-containing protein [Escherichia coli]EFB2176737.1 DUF551 domain-containing protein [Escherichia coli]EFB3781879.1 DUF551 domain-containing protein [Escherichia coli]EFB4036308.1 DUF551 domain-containing protein [Escherichia coli]EFC3505722.1 DUF551 domain-containing protein [Escherichia coli]EFC4786563.1 DUF551 domain-containing protein [Escherichia coli]